MAVINNRILATTVDGNGIKVSLAWRDHEGQPDDPVSVQYQVFDYLTGDALSDIVTVPSPAATMSFIIPASDLPGDTSPNRRVVVQVQGSFPTDNHIEHLHVSVLRRFTFEDQ